MRNDGFTNRGGTECFGKAGLAEGTNANTIQIATAIGFAIDGIAYSKAITDNIAMNALATQPALHTCLYLVQIDSAGAVTLKKGVDTPNADLDGGKAGMQWPEADANKCAIGGLKVRCNNAATFTSGTTDLGAADVVETYFDFAGGGPHNPVIT